MDPDPHQPVRHGFSSVLRIPDPDFYPSRIPDPTTATKERVEKKFIVIPLLYPQISHNCKLFNF
jgi:hypothetical protein